MLGVDHARYGTVRGRTCRRRALQSHCIHHGYCHCPHASLVTISSNKKNIYLPSPSPFLHANLFSFTFYPRLLPHRNARMGWLQTRVTQCSPLPQCERHSCTREIPSTIMTKHFQRGLTIQSLRKGKIAGTTRQGNARMYTNSLLSLRRIGTRAPAKRHPYNLSSFSTTPSIFTFLLICVSALFFLFSFF